MYKNLMQKLKINKKRKDTQRISNLKIKIKVNFTECFSI